MLGCSQSRRFCSIPFPLRLDVDRQALTTSEEEPPIDDKIQPIETFAESESATDFKGFEALHNTIPDINDQLLCSDVQTEARQMYDELWRLFKTFQRNITKLTLNVKHEKCMHTRQMTLHDMFKQSSMNPDFCQKNCAWLSLARWWVSNVSWMHEGLCCVCPIAIPWWWGGCRVPKGEAEVRYNCTMPQSV